MDPNRPKSPDDYRNEGYGTPYATGLVGMNGPLTELLTAVLVAVGTTVRFVIRSWMGWWRTEPRGAALYTCACAVLVGLWLTWPSAPGHAAVAGAAFGIRMAMGIAGAVVVGGIPGSFLAKWRVARRKLA